MREILTPPSSSKTSIMNIQKTTKTSLKRRTTILLATLLVTSTNAFPQENDNNEKLFQKCIAVGDKTIENEQRKRAAEKCIVAARNGDARAFSYAGLIFAIGDFVQKDEKQAVEYWTHGARIGDPASIRMMAILFEKGQWVTQDISKSRKLFQIAADLGDRIAIERVSEQRKLKK